MKVNTIISTKALMAAIMLGVFAVAVAAPVTLDMSSGALTTKSAFAKDGADDGPDAADDRGGHGGDDGPDAADDRGGHGGDDGPGHQ